MTIAWTLLALFAATATIDDDDVLLADFEQQDYGTWTTTGEAFGSGPAHGTLAGQMNVDGFLGKGLVNSFLNGDQTVGTLTSESFNIQRNFLNFLIGGGRHPETAMHLIVDDEVVRKSWSA